MVCIKQLKLKNEVGMAGSKSTQTRFVGIITLAFLDYHDHALIDVNLFVLSFREYS